jgi:hypothetical protein
MIALTLLRLLQWHRQDGGGRPEWLPDILEPSA